MFHDVNNESYTIHFCINVKMIKKKQCHTDLLILLTSIHVSCHFLLQTFSTGSLYKCYKTPSNNYLTFSSLFLASESGQGACVRSPGFLVMGPISNIFSFI